MSALFYTSRTTGDPKGVLYSHRSTILHSLSTVSPQRTRSIAKSGKRMNHLIMPNERSGTA
jgi:fatty-acyl-CoA synthase